MTRIRLKYVHQFVDGGGRPRFYFRRGGKRVALPSNPFSAEFEAAYKSLLEGSASGMPASRIIPGTVGAAAVGYLASGAFQALAPNTQKRNRFELNAIVRDYADKRLAMLERRHVAQILDGKTSGAARDFLRGLRLIVKYALSVGIISTDPTAGVRLKLPKSGGHPTWTEDDIAAFEAAYPIGTKQRLALALLLGTALRVSDLTRIGRGHVRDGMLRVTQQKTGAPLSIPITTNLWAIINASPIAEQLLFLVADNGRPFNPSHFSKWFRDQCTAVGLKGLGAHGLRKAACRRMAEAGCSANEIAAISGHVTLTEVARYTKAADQARMAKNAIERTERERELANFGAELPIRPKSTDKTGV
jgi:integrase